MAVVKAQRMAGLTPRSLAGMASAWRHYYRWAVKYGLVTADPTTTLTTPKASKPLPKALAADVAERLLKKATITDTKVGSTEHTLHQRDRALLEVLYGAGLRAAEILSLDTHKHASSQSWLDTAAGEVQVLGKGGKTRRVPLPRLALVAVNDWLAVRSNMLPATQSNAEPALFLGKRGARLGGSELRRATQRMAQHAELGQGVHPHMLRHSYASHLLQSSGDLRAVQELLGHSSITATQVYTRLDFLHLAKVYDKAHPRAGRKAD